MVNMNMARELWSMEAYSRKENVKKMRCKVSPGDHGMICYQRKEGESKF